MTEQIAGGGASLAPVPREELDDLADRLAAARRRLAAAEQAVAQDKAQRAAAGLLARLDDLVSETAPEAALSVAQGVIAKLDKLAAAKIAAWMAQRPAELAAADDSMPARAALMRRHLDLCARHDRLVHWHSLARDAVDTMERGARRCTSAARTETLDAVSSSPMASLASLGASGLAKEALQDAMQAIARLRAALPGHGVPGDALVNVGPVEDGLDTFVDLFSRPAFDVLSWQNMNRHEAVAQKLEVTARMLVPLRVHLAQLADKTLAELEPAAPEAEAVIALYRDAALAEVPAELRPFAEIPPG